MAMIGVPLLVVVADVVVDAERDRPAVAAAAVEGGGEDEVRPGPQEREQRDGDDRVAADRQHDRPEGAPVRRAVDLRGLQQLVGDAGHERGEDQHAERHGEGGVGEDQAGHGVEQAEVEVDA